MASFNETITDLLEGLGGGTQASPIAVPFTESPQGNGTIAGWSVGGFLGCLFVLVVIAVALRRRVDFLADLSDRIVTLAEALCWRQGSGAVQATPTDGPALVAPLARNMTDDEVIQLRRVTSQCEEPRPECEYV